VSTKSDGKVSRNENEGSNADTRAYHDFIRNNEQARRSRSQLIRDRERRAREKALKERDSAMFPYREYQA
jgi:hypothetical protein